MFFALEILFLATLCFFHSKKILLSRKQHSFNNNYISYYSSIAVSWYMIIIFIIFGFFFFINFLNNITLLITPIISYFILYIITIKVPPSFKVKKYFESNFSFLLKTSSLISISVTLLIVISILFEALRFFSEINIFDFLLGTQWSPQTASSYSTESSHSKVFGAIPVFLGTFLITVIAMIIAIPLGLLSAIFLSEYSSNKFRAITKPVLEILAGIPTVVYGYFAAFTVAPFIKNLGESMNITVSSESALAAGIVMGIMIIPFVLSLSEDVMKAVPDSLRSASLGLGATTSETVKKVIIPSALPGIIGAVLLAISRAIGETMIVTMAAGLNANLTLNPLESVTTATAQIVTLLVGDQEFDSSKTLAAFALGITLFVITLLLNIIALMIVKKYREKYE